MLFKLAFQNIRRSKGYFIAYMLTIAAFFVIVYQIGNIEAQLVEYFDKGIHISGISLEGAFLTLKYVMYVVIFFFAVYISRFFIKRRSKEIALLKTLGLNRRSIWKLFLIENALVVIVGLVVGLVLAVLTSRLFAILAFNLINLAVQDVGFAFIDTGLIDIAVLMIIIYIVISITPLRTIAKSSIIELFSNQVKNDEYTKKPIVSLILFIVFTALLLYQAFFFLPTNPTFSIITLLLYLANAILVAIFLYRGILIYFFINYRNKQKGINSPIKLLSLNHMAANISGIYKMMAFITIISAIITVTVLTTFGYLNAMNGRVSNLNNGVALKYVSTDKKAITDMNREFRKSGESYQSFPVYFVDNLDSTYIDDVKNNHFARDVNQRNTILIKQSDYQKFLEAKNIEVDKGVLVSNVKVDCQKPGKDASYCQFLKKQDININSLTYSSYLDKMVRSEFHAKDFLKDEKTDNASENENARLFNNFIEPDIVVLKDDNKLFNSLEHVYFTGFNKVITDDKMFDYFDVFFNSPIPHSENIVVLNPIILAQMEGIVTTGVFQILLLMICVVTLIALMMAIFFRTLENLEKGVNEYVIAKRVGMSQKQVGVSVFIEAFLTQIFPFILGMGVAIPLYNQIIVGRLMDVDSFDVNVIYLLREPATFSILLVIVVSLLTLLIILIILINKKISDAQQIKSA